jgi:hypothetical protein
MNTPMAATPCCAWLGTCPAASGELELGYRLLFDLDNLHRGLLRVSVDGTTHTAVLSPTSGTMRWGAQAVSRVEQFRQYLVEGIWHIWIGFDHILSWYRCCCRRYWCTRPGGGAVCPAFVKPVERCYGL